LIRRFKFEEGRFLREFFSFFLFKEYKRNGWSVDFVTFVPMTKKEFKGRGYNQTELLAKSFSSLSGIPVQEVMKKTRETKRQVGLTGKERRENLKGAFTVYKRKATAGKTVLLIDDVTTTGSTAEIISDKLKRSGAKRVYVLTVATVSDKNLKGD
ncbi:MAG: ComF family protein, partial [Clostridia bacterium]|nr:ComF family protein [Clostridia bacterium]